MSSLFHTDDLEAGERFEFWRESVSETWVPMECFTDNETGFWAQVRTGGLGAVKVNLMTAAPHGVRRTRRLIRQADPDLLKVLILLSGDCVISTVPVLVAARRRGVAQSVLSPLAVAYWAMHWAATWRAVHQLISSPFTWEKTPHRADLPHPVVAESAEAFAECRATRSRPNRG